jgi:hypothetical protein
MEINTAYTLNYIIVITWVLSISYSLIKLRGLEINPIAQALWGVVILFFPFVGVIAFLMVNGKRLT